MSYSKKPKKKRGLLKELNHFQQITPLPKRQNVLKETKCDSLQKNSIFKLVSEIMNKRKNDCLKY